MWLQSGMRAVGLRELKAHLSRFVREVVAGEVVLVTDRGRVVAELRPPTGADEPESALDRRLRRLSEHCTLHVGRHDPTVYGRSPISVRPGTAQALLDAERIER